jgi:predicted O-linked N-acetylglucosamine transferase (SPINDLY family)
MNDRQLQRKIASLYRAPADEPLARAGGKRADGRIHVGFLSSHFDRHTIGKLQRGLIAELSREEFFVTVLSIGHGDDDVAEFIRSRADRYIELPRGLPQARQVIREAGLDILYYCDIGMDATSYSLAFSRLAPVQCATWGHPVTTGIGAIDYFISSRLMEPSGAEEHYTEKLVPLDSLSIGYHRPPAPREAFGLHPDGHLYVCPQSIYKFHPEFDGLLGEILRRDPQGRVVLIRWAYGHADELLRRRFEAAMPDVAGRIDFIARLQQAEFVGLLGVADVILDPIHFGGGHTSLDALALGTPVVTLPGQFLRGRITLGLYRKMGLLDCVAEDPEQYVRIAVRLGTDPAYRHQVQARIRDASAALFEDRDSVRQLEAFFRQCVKGGG